MRPCGRRRAGALARGFRLAALVLGLVLCARGAEASLTIEAHLDRSEIEPLTQQAELTVTVRSTGLRLAEPRIPIVPGLRLERSASMQNFSMVQGRVERSVTAVYHVTGKAEGRYTIPPIEVRLGKDRAATEPIMLVIRKGAHPDAPPAGGGRAVPPGEIPPTLPEVFAAASVDKSQVYWNEQLLLTLRLYARVRLLEEPDWKPPGAPGFWVEDVGAPISYTTRLNGVEFAVLESRAAMFPTRTGKLRIGPARIRCRIGRVRRAPDPWSSLGVPEIEPADLTLETKPIDIDVRPLPPGAPAGFSGAVGRYGFAVKVDRRLARVGEPVLISTRVEGEGNVPSIQDPSVRPLGTARAYEAGSSARIQRDAPPIRGERTREVAVVADRDGPLIVAPVVFAWFDPSEGRYRMQHSDTIRVRVVPGGTTALSERGDTLAAPIAAMRRTPGRTASLSPEPPPGSIALGGASLLAYAGTLAWARHRARRERDPRRGRRDALRRLLDLDFARARSLARAGDEAGATAAAAEALLQAVGLRFDIATGGRPRPELLAELDRRGASEAELASFVALLESLERAAYAPPEVRARDVDRSLAEAAARVERYVGDLR